jgi:hypothetical protein
MAAIPPPSLSLKYGDVKWMILMENYILRIYRRDECQPGSVIGLVEVVETGEKQSFKTLTELMSILAGTSTMIGQTATAKLCYASA